MIVAHSVRTPADSASGGDGGRVSWATMGRRLLIVDDEADMLDFLDRVFRREYEVMRAQSVDEAVRHIEAGRLDVIVTDRRMPRRSGLELLEIAAQRQPTGGAGAADRLRRFARRREGRAVAARRRLGVEADRLGGAQDGDRPGDRQARSR